MTFFPLGGMNTNMDKSIVNVWGAIVMKIVFLVLLWSMKMKWILKLVLGHREMHLHSLQ